MTLVLGRNNAGKTALLSAPLFATYGLDPKAPTPFPNNRQAVDFGPLQSVCFNRRPIGLTMTLALAGIPGAERIVLGAMSVPEQGHMQRVTELEIEGGHGGPTRMSNVPWSQARDALRAIPALSEVAHSVDILRGLRPTMARFHPYQGYVPERVGPEGQDAAAILAAADDAGFWQVSSWFERIGIRLGVKSVGNDAFEIEAAGLGREFVNLVDSGEGIAHVLPLVVAMRLAKRTPSLFCIEQPELHLHPPAHAEVAELLLESLQERPNMRLLVETHSDVLILRIRRAIAEGRIAPGNVRLYFVEETGQGSIVRPIVLNDRGAPEWWPEGVFAEPQNEYFAIQKALSGRQGSP